MLLGLAISVAVNLLLVEPPMPPLPGVALGSSLLLVVERVVAMFAAWLAVGLVLAEAWRGRLPTEISGRGVRYASVESTQDAAQSVDTALLRHEASLRQMESRLFELEEWIDRERRG